MISKHTMWRLTLLFTVACVYATSTPRSGEELVDSVFANCADMPCVKSTVLSYLDNILNIQSESARNFKNIDAAILKRTKRVLDTHEIRYTLPEMLFEDTQVVYNPQSGLDITTPNANEGRGLLKKKLLLPALLLLKLKMKALMPIMLAIVKIKAIKALILSKLAILIVIGFIIYQLVTKAGMSMPMNMSPMAPPPEPVYGPPPTTAPPSSYEPGWEPSGTGPYSRVWTEASSDNAQNIAYSAYYPGSASSSTSRP